MASTEKYGNIGKGHYELAAGGTCHRFGFGFSIDWYGPKEAWNICLNLDLLFFWFAIGYSDWHLK